MSLSNSNPVQKLVIGGEPLKKSVATENQKSTTVINPAKISEENIKVTSEALESTINTTESKHEEQVFVEEKIAQVTIEDNNVQSMDVKKTETPKQTIPNNNLIKDEETLKMLKSLAFWSKFHIILGFISAGLLIFAGIIYIFLIITIPITILYWIIAGITIWLLVKLYKGFSKFEQLTDVKTQDDFNVKTLEGLNYLNSYYKITGIFQIISFALGMLLIVVGIVLLIAFGNNPSFQESLKEATDAQKSMNPSMLK